MEYIFYLKDELCDVLGKMWTSLPEYTSFFKKFKDIKRYYRHYSKNKVKELRKTELDTKAKLKLATVPLHESFTIWTNKGWLTELSGLWRRLKRGKRREWQSAQE